MNSHRALLLSTLLLLSSTAAQAQTGPFCPPVANPDCADDECKTVRYTCGSPMANDPVDMSYGNSYQRFKDIEIAGSVQNLKFLRTYVSHNEAWNYEGLLRGETPKPFGPSTVALQPQPSSTSLNWWHNFYSMVYPKGFDASSLWDVRDPDGHLLQFRGCTGTCIAPLSSTNTRTDDRLSYIASSGAPGDYGKFVLLRGNLRYVYGAYYSPGDSIKRRYFLSRIESVVGSPEVVVATIQYALPFSDCPHGDTTSTPGVPYIDRIINEDGKALKFNYVKLSLPTLNSPHCVIRSISIEDHGASTGGGSTVTSPVVEYSYRLSGTEEEAGRLASAYWPQSGRAEQYTYALVSSQSTFKKVQDGYERSAHAYDTTTSRVSVATAGGERLVVSYWGAVGAGECGSGTIGENLNACCVDGEKRTVQDDFAQKGDGTAGAAPLRRDYIIADATQAWHGPRVQSITDRCDRTSGSANCPAISEGSAVYYWKSLTSTTNQCDVNPDVNVETAIQNKRGWWTNFSYTTVAGTLSKEIVLTGVKRGTLSSTGLSPLETEDYGYQFIGGSDSLYGRYPSFTERPSLLAPTGTPFPIARVSQKYDSTHRTRTATFRAGWTRDAINSDVLSAPVKRFIGTFYIGASTDPKRRPLEVHGPCWVASESATDCGSGAYPLTQFEYWPDTETSNRKGQLKKILRYPQGAGSMAHLDTLFEEYDAFGNPTRIVDENGVVSTYTYQDNKVTTRTVGSATTTFAYENGELKWVQHPEGNYEVFCHRTATNPTDPAGCTGAWSPLLQWKAKSANQTGTTWSEKVTFTYWDDQTLKEEAYLSACTSSCSQSSGEIRKVQKYAADAHRRPTWQGAGDNPSSAGFTSVRSYDGADNLTGIGLPYNQAPAWCGGVTGQAGTALSKLCSSLSYDRANRLESVTEYPSGPLGAGVKTCFDHDSHGNVRRVISGCQTTESCSGLDPNPNFPQQCKDTAAEYYYDDFDRLVLATLPDTGTASGRGSIRYAYDAMGNLVEKQTETQNQAGTFTEYVYDQIGRLTTSTIRLVSGYDLVSTLSALDYDQDGPTLDSACGSVTNTLGRLRARTDSFGTTWYSYDTHGRVVAEIRLRAGASCSGSVNDHPHTFYTYTTNGNLASVTYPYSRVVTYGYYSANGMNDRIQQVSVGYGSLPWQPQTIISDVAWEPYGGLRAYQINTLTPAGSAAVEYVLGDDGSVVPSGATPTCQDTRPGSAASDHTGRLRALLVTPGLLSASETTRKGQIFQRTYSWQADQIKTQDTCLLWESGDSARRESYAQAGAYDQQLRLRLADRPTGNFDAAGGAFTQRQFNYDARGNRSSEVIDGCSTVSSTYNSNHRAEQLTLRDTQCGRVSHGFTYDADGRVTTKNWANDSVGTSHQIVFNYRSTSSGSSDEGGDSVYKSVQINGSATYGYLYDSIGRRRLKSYPTGVDDEYFYDQGHQMLVDRGNDVLDTSLRQSYPLDEYIWLGGRPVALVRSRMDLTWGRQADGTGTCSRAGTSDACGLFFIVTDHIGKPVLMLDSNRKVVGAADYDPFGYPNRVQHYASTSFPYGNNLNQVVAQLKQPVVRNTSSKLRVLFHQVDTESCSNQLLDYASLADQTGTGLGAQPITGSHQGSRWSDWVSVPSDGRVDVRFRSNARNCSPATACSCTSDEGHSYAGVSVEAYEYQRYETGAMPSWIPLRFPGQYHDAETDLFENWNRYYEPSTGRYLQPEPMLEGSLAIMALAKRGMRTPAYAYATNNPLRYADPTGFYVWDSSNGVTCPNWAAAVELAKQKFGCTNPKCDKGSRICAILEDGSGPRAFAPKNGMGGSWNKQAITIWDGSAELGYWHAQGVAFNMRNCFLPDVIPVLAHAMIHEGLHLLKEGGPYDGDYPTWMEDPQGTKEALFGGPWAEDYANDILPVIIP